jgi:DNA polymerase/3'-5' exonuclease PolX
MAISLRDLSVAQLKRATAIKERIEQLEKDLTRILGIPEPMTVGGVVRRRKQMSAAARAKISAAAKARWAKVRTGKSASTGSAEPATPKRTMSAAARKRISEAVKARWARQKAGK